MQPKMVQASVAVPPAPVRGFSRKQIAPNVESVTSIGYDNYHNEMIPGTVHRSPDI